LSWEDQSAGTRGWISLVSHALNALANGGLLVVDEVDASLHPHLTARLIQLFRDAETNTRNAQLLFTTHDATLLDEDTLSRDEVWFVEKDADSGSTRLYPLTDFHPRKNENTEGRYLAGSYGAVPVLSDSAFRDALLRAGHAAA
jgi:AAA15 family ATPase/GTPase